LLFNIIPIFNCNKKRELFGIIIWLSNFKSIIFFFAFLFTVYYIIKTSAANRVVFRNYFIL